MRVSSVFVALKNLARLLGVRNFTPRPFPCQGRQEREEKATICSVPSLASRCVSLRIA
jgi:hypothetical protein